MTEHIRMPFTVECNYWTKAQVAFLVSHYTYMGDVEMSELLNQQFPRYNSCFTRRHVAKKRVRMELFRTPEQLTMIRERNNRQQRYDTQAARAAHQQQIRNVTDRYIMSCCLRFPTSSHPKLLRDHQMLIRLKRTEIIKKRAERNYYAIQ